MLSALTLPDFESLHMNADHAGRILVFDSGVGGLSVYEHIKRHLPDAGVLYVADRAGFPYGDWQADALTAHIVGLVRGVCEVWQPSAVVIACNTASTLVLPPLREVLSIPVVGTVPAIKPAAERSQSRLFSVLATPGTVTRDYTRDLIAAYAPEHHVTLVGATGLAALAEDKLAGRNVDFDRLANEIAPCFVELEGKRTDCVVLGCTHYPFLKDEMKQVAPWEVEWIDPSSAIAKRVTDVVAPERLVRVHSDLFFEISDK